MPKAVTLIRSDALSDAQYAYAATAPTEARLVFLAGSCPLDMVSKLDCRCPRSGAWSTLPA